ncbi:MAG TPA: alpha-2-macroglobulin family protein, partial [Opitutus sp.]|nr:alpha-2-macroglobulin family protein [Opitutus sp.]
MTFTEYAAAQKLFGDTLQLHVMNLADGRGAAGVRVRAVTWEYGFVAEAVTNRDGTAEFSQAKLRPTPGSPARYFVIETPDGPMMQDVDAEHYAESGYPVEAAKAPAARLVVATDRPIYRPGQVVKFKAFAREVTPDGLRVPRRGKMTWEISEAGGDRITGGSGYVDDYGGADGEWKIPDSAKVELYEVTVTCAGASANQDFNVQEFRPPPFTVTAEDMQLPGGVAGVRVTSAYFHGAVNAGAHVKWTADWTRQLTGDDTIVIAADGPRIISGRRERGEQASGEGTLGNDGTLEIKNDCPFKEAGPRGWYHVSWKIDVTGPDGQTISQEASYPVYATDEQLTVSGWQEEAKPGEAKDAAAVIGVQASATTSGTMPLGNSPVVVDVYKVGTKTAKEQISGSVYRYKNTVLFEKVKSVEGRTPFKQEITIGGPGEYFVAARDPGNAAVPACVQRIYVGGPGQAEFAVKDEESIGVKCDKGDYGDGSNFYAPGDKANFTVQSPFAGMAWVTVETSTVLDTFYVPLEGNAGKFEVPIKKEYAPNAWVSVYLLKGGGADQLPAERFGSVEIAVRPADQRLDVKPVFASSQVHPGQPVTGEVDVNCQGKPVADADVTVYAVDESILDAGDWHEPPLRDDMYPLRNWNVGTYHGLQALSFGVDTASLHQKGFIVGGDVVAKAVMSPAGEQECRTNFPPLAYWKTELRTDKEGKVAFNFTAPDALTKYRVIALAQTKQSQFGTGSECVEVSKPVQIEPALPRFVRVGDEIELRAVVRQKVADELPVTVHCATTLELVGEGAQTQTVKRGIASVFRFHAKAGELASASVSFATDAGPGDAVKMSLPVYPPTLLRKEAVYTTLSEIQKRIPDEWTKATGSAEITVSTSPWLPKLTGLPEVLDYPHGCFEQITSRVLCYTVLDDLLAYLPEPASREENYKQRMDSGLQTMLDNIIDDSGKGGFLPYWPGEAASPVPTVAGCWAVEKAAARGMKVPDGLQESLEEGTLTIAKGGSDVLKVDPYSRAFALMV